MEINKATRKKIEKDLIIALSTVLTGYNKLSVKKIEKILKKESKQIAKTFLKEVKKFEKKKIKARVKSATSVSKKRGRKSIR